MEAVLSEMPLALFTTLAPMGAGAFVALAAVFLTAEFTPEQLKKIDRMTLIPLAFVVAGFIAAFFHLTAPGNAFGVLGGAGSSPLSNEVVAGVLFVVAAVVYVVVALAGKLHASARKAFACVVAVLALVFAAFTGLAYAMHTISSWDTPLAPVGTVGLCLVGGVALGLLAVALGGGVEALEKSGSKVALAVVAVVGLAAGIVSVFGQQALVSGLESHVALGADVAGAAMPAIVVAAVGLVAACACVLGTLRGKKAVAWASLATVAAFVGILGARLAFYAMEFSVGLTL